MCSSREEGEDGAPDCTFELAEDDWAVSPVFWRKTKKRSDTIPDGDEEAKRPRAATAYLAKHTEKETVVAGSGKATTNMQPKGSSTGCVYFRS